MHHMLISEQCQLPIHVEISAKCQYFNEWCQVVGTFMPRFQGEQYFLVLDPQSFGGTNS